MYAENSVDIIYIWLYMLVSDNVNYMFNFWVSNMQYVYQTGSESNICIKWYLSDKQRSAVWSNVK